MKERKDFESMAEFLEYVMQEERKMHGYSPLAGEKEGGMKDDSVRG